ncbi:cation transporter [Ensifer adhaerens]|uniref:cation transporter n=1 Tax=Ensifer adhaerens TaxID=106592 RepID=UPI00069D97A8
MDGASCASKTDTAVRRMPGVEDVLVSVAAGTMLVKHDDDGELSANIVSKAGNLGYRLHPIAAHQTPPIAVVHTCSGHHDHDHPHDHDHDHDEHTHAHDHAHEHQHSHNAARSTLLQQPSSHAHDHGPANGPWWRSGKGRLTIACGLALAAAYGLGHLVPATEPWIFTLAMLVGLLPIARRAFAAATSGMPRPAAEGRRRA